MAEHETLSEARESRINEAVQFFDDEFQRVQKELGARRKSIEKEFASKRKTVEKRTRKELKRIQSELKKNPIVKRADTVRKDVTKQVETRVDSLLGLMQVASKSDVQRINKKLTTLNRRLKAIEDLRKTNGSSPSI
jgi:phage-related minor tail protein